MPLRRFDPNDSSSSEPGVGRPTKLRRFDPEVPSSSSGDSSASEDEEEEASGEEQQPTKPFCGV